MNTDNFLWDFGNGMLSTDSFPSLIYVTDGEFIPSLIITNSSGCQFTINNSDTIKVGLLMLMRELMLKSVRGGKFN